MKKFTSDELRKAWKQFYIDRGHVDCGAVSLVSDGSTGVMFNVAGMQPLMPYLLGKKHPMGTRLCNVQGCVRTNDIDSVGDKSHATFFEMMGSWSLGDYFKEERCKWSFELLTEVFGFDPDHLAATVFAGDENAPRDEEGAKYRIASGFKKENIFYLPAEDNWWGLEYGPCGPDSEMFYVNDKEKCGPDCRPGCHCGKYTELGNDVFMQYEKKKDGTLAPLAQKNVDTGWGLERILAFLNGLDDVYKIDLYQPVIALIEAQSGFTYDADEKQTRSMRILADHMRTSVMLIGDEAKLVPSNVGAGYVLRRLIRRAVRHARILGIDTDGILKIATLFIDQVYAESYPNLTRNREFILTELRREIERFESTLENGMRELQKILERLKTDNKKTIDGKDAFFLYDTYGFPLELTVELAGEENLTVDEEGFALAMEDQKQKARNAQSFSAKLGTDEGVFDSLDGEIKSKFVGYEELRNGGTILAMAGKEGTKPADVLSKGEEGTLITDVTPFYGTMGGQEGDTGKILAGENEFTVTGTLHLPGDRIGHVGIVTKGSFRTGDTVTLSVDEKSRLNTCRNHSATHLLQKALKTVLGDHVEQKGSFVNPERLRFDFSHNEAMSEDEIRKTEEMVNEAIRKAYAVTTEEMGLEEAKKTGAMALFGEKYGDRVRVVSMGESKDHPFSVELCGGTHVKNTSQIMQFKIVSEASVSSGVRRIEALTGDGVIAYYREAEKKLLQASALLKVSPDALITKIEGMQSQIRELNAELNAAKSKAAKEALGDVSDSVQEIKGVKACLTRVSGVDMNGLRELGDQMKAKLPGGVVLLFSEDGGKVNIVAMAADEAVQKGVHAGNLIKAVAPLVGGGGGGRPNMAQAGGKDPSGIDGALAESAKVLESQIR